MKRITGKVNKKEKKNSHIALKMTIVVILILITIILLLSTVKVKKIDINIHGNETVEENQDENEEPTSAKVTTEEINSLIGVSINDKMFQKSKKEMINSIKQNPYVNEVIIKRKLNGNLSVDVTLKEVAYLINYAGTYVYIDNLGYVLELNEQQVNAPILIGTTTDLSGLSIDKSQTKLNDDDLENLNVVNSIMDSAKSNDIANLITSIDITDKKNYTLRFETEGKTAYLGECKDINTRILFIKAILEKEKGNNGEIFANGNLDIQDVYFRESI